MKTLTATHRVPVSYTGTIYGYIDCSEEQAEELLGEEQFYFCDIENLDEDNLTLFTSDVYQDAFNGDSYFDVDPFEKGVESLIGG